MTSDVISSTMHRSGKKFLVIMNKYNIFCTINFSTGMSVINGIRYSQKTMLW